MKSQKVLAFCLCILILCSLILAACGKDKNTQTTTADEVKITTETAANDSYENITESSEKVITTAPATITISTEVSTTVPEKTTAAPKDEKPQQNNNSSAGPVESKPMTCTITVDEKDYTVEKDSIVTYTYYLKTPKMIENVQASVIYTPNCLQLIEEDIEKNLPIVHNGAIINIGNPGVVNYNSINLSGFDFREEGVLVTLKFKVIFGGTGAIANSIAFMDEKGAEVAYVDNYKMSKDIKVREEIKIK